MLGRSSADAIKAIVAKPQDRRNVVAKLMQACGRKLKEYSMTTGPNDLTVAVEAPDGEDAVVASMVAAASGVATNVTTIRVWSTREFKKLAERAKGAATSYEVPKCI